MKLWRDTTLSTFACCLQSSPHTHTLTPPLDPQISADEMKKVVACFGSESSRNDAYGTGLHLAGERYVLTGADEKELKLKQGKEGVFVVKSTQAILLGHYPETVQPGSANTVIGQLGDYLVSVGY